MSSQLGGKDAEKTTEENNQRVTEKVEDLRQLVKILNDLKDYSELWVEQNEEKKVKETASWTLEKVCDLCVNNPSYIKECSESVIFGFNQEQKQKFVNDIENFRILASGNNFELIKNKQAEIKNRYLKTGIVNLSLLLGLIIIPSITIITKGSLCGSVLNYQVELKPNITIREIFTVCKKFTEHELESIQLVEYMNPKQIRIVIGDFA